jgi:hypothetical protein
MKRINEGVAMVPAKLVGRNKLLQALFEPVKAGL